MNEQRLREMMDDSVGDIHASDSLRVRVSAAIGGRRARRRTAVRGWIAVGGAAVAAAAVLLAVPLIRTPQSAPPGTGVGLTAPTTTGGTAVEDVGEVLGDKKWYVVGIVAHGSSLALDPPTGADTAMSIQLTDSGLQGHDGCNWIGSDPALLTSVPNVRVNISSTGMLCTRVSHGQDEFLRALRNGPKTWSHDGDRVVLTAAGIEVTFSKDRTARPPSTATVLSSEQDVVELLGVKTWYVTEILEDGAPVKLYRPKSPDRWMRISMERGSLSGWDGCNWLGASPALLSRGASTVGMSATAMMCDPVPAGHDQFLASLRENVKSWMAEGDRLSLQTSTYDITFSSTTPTGSAPVVSSAPNSFSDPAGLRAFLGSDRWKVKRVSMDGVDVRAEPPGTIDPAIWLELEAAGVRFYDGCNFISAPEQVLRNDAQSPITAWVTTQAACPVLPKSDAVRSAVAAGPKSWSHDGARLLLSGAGFDVEFVIDRGARTTSRSTG